MATSGSEGDFVISLSSSDDDNPVEDSGGNQKKKQKKKKIWNRRKKTDKAAEEKEPKRSSLIKSFITASSRTFRAKKKPSLEREVSFSDDDVTLDTAAKKRHRHRSRKQRRKQRKKNKTLDTSYTTDASMDSSYYDALSVSGIESGAETSSSSCLENHDADLKSVTGTAVTDHLLWEDDPQQQQQEQQKVTAKSSSPRASMIASVALIMGVCIGSMILVPFNWIIWIACISTIALSDYMVYLNGHLQNPHDLHELKRSLRWKRTAWKTANYNMKERLAERRNMIKLQSSLERQLETILAKPPFTSSSTTQQQPRQKQDLVQLTQRYQANRQRLYAKLRQQVLLTVTKAVLIGNKKIAKTSTNKKKKQSPQKPVMYLDHNGHNHDDDDTSHEHVLNAATIQLIIGRVKNMTGVKLYVDSLQKIVQEHGESSIALKELYRQVAAPQSATLPALFEYSVDALLS